MMKKNDQLLMQLFSVRIKTDMMKSQENMLYLPSSIVENEEVILLINSQGWNAGSANRRRMSELNVVNTNAGVKKRKRKQTEKENV